jgi:para-nitrobenzyl esterase
VRPGPGGEALLAYHGAEIPYVFDTQDTWLTGDAVDARLGAAMQADWLAFMRNGDPNEGGAVGADRAAGWPEFGSGLIEELGTRVGPMAPPDRALCREIAAELYR